MVCAWSLRLIKEIGKKCVKLQEKRYLFFSIFNLSRSPFKEVIRQIICWVSRGTTMVMEVKLPYFHGRGSTTVVAVKKSSIAQKLRIHSEMEEKNLTDVMKYLSLVKELLRSSSSSPFGCTCRGRPSPSTVKRY